MANSENPNNGRQASGLNLAFDASKSFGWDEPPQCFLNPEQQIKFKSSRDLSTLGEKIWSTIVPKTVLVVSGKVRLREEGADKPLATLATGDWFGDLLEISGQLKL